MLADRAHTALSLGESLSLSGIGMAVVFLELILLAVAIMLISQLLRRLSPKEDTPTIGIIGSTDGPTAVFVASAPAAPAAPAPAAAAPTRSLTLTKVDEPTAAVLMALVAHQTGIAPERLDFHSIRLIEED